MQLNQVHNHGTEEGPGLNCPEHTTPAGKLRGQCITQERENALYLAATERESDLYVGTATIPLRIIEADYHILNISTPIHGDLPLWNTEPRYRVLIGGRRAGKTTRLRRHLRRWMPCPNAAQPATAEDAPTAQTPTTDES